MGCSPSVTFFSYIMYLCFISLVWGFSLCSHETDVFIKNLHFQCSPSISPILPLKVDGSFLDQALTSKQRNGFEPVQFIAENEAVVSGDGNKYAIQLWNETLKEIVKREPCIAFAFLFLCFRGLLSIFPKVTSSLKAFWFSCAPHLNLEIFGETSQLFARALHMVEVRRVWMKLSLCKTRNFHRGAKSDHVWASLSLGNFSSVRSSSSS